MATVTCKRCGRSRDDTAAACECGETARVFQKNLQATVRVTGSLEGEHRGLIREVRKGFIAGAGVIQAGVPLMVGAAKYVLRHHPGAGEGVGTALEQGGERASESLLKRAVREVYGVKGRFSSR